MKKTNHRQHRPTATGTILKEKEKNERSPNSPPLTVDGVRVKNARK